MAGPGGAEIGRLSIRVVADTTGMKEKIRRDAERAGQRIRVPVEANTSRMISEVVAAKEALAERPIHIEVEPRVSTGRLRAATTKAARAAERGQRVDVNAHLNTSNFMKGMYALRAELADKTWRRPLIEPALSKQSVRRLEDELQDWQALATNKLLKGRIFEVDGELVIKNVANEIKRVERELKDARIEMDAAFQGEKLRRDFFDTLAEFDEAWWKFNQDANKNTVWMDQWEADLDRTLRKTRIAQLQIEQNEKNYLDLLDRRTRRLSIYTRLFREELAVALGGTAVSGLVGGLSLVVGYLGASVAPAAALAGALQQAASAWVMLPGLLVGGAGAIAALAIGLQGFGDAVSAVLDEDTTPEELAEALDNLTPSARRAALAIRDTLPVWRQLREGIQESLFVGMDGAIKRLSEFAVAMRPSLMSIASGWNAVFNQITGGLASDISSAGFATTFQNFSKMMTAWSAGVPNMIAGLATLSASASQFFELFGQWGAEKLQNFEGWVGRITSDGTLERWVNNARSAFGDLWATLKNFGGALGNVFELAGPKAFLSQVRGIAFEFRSWTESAAGVGALVGFFQSARQVLRDVHSVARDLGPVFFALADGVAGFTGNFASAFTPAMEGAGAAAREFGAALAGLGGPMAEILASALKEVGGLAGDLGPSLAILGRNIAPFVEDVAAFVGSAGGVFITMLSTALELMNKLGDVGIWLAQVLGAVFAVRTIASWAQNLGAELVQTATNFTAAGKAAESYTVKQTAAGVSLERAAPKAGRFSSALGRLPGIMALATAGFALFSMAWDAMPWNQNKKTVEEATQQFAQLHRELDKGGAAAIQAAADYEHMMRMADGMNEVMDGWGDLVVEGAEEAAKAHEKYIASLSSVEQAQLKVDQANADAAYWYEHGGVHSTEYANALDDLTAASWALEAAKIAEAAAQRTAGDAVKDQVEAYGQLTALQGNAAQAQLNMNDSLARYNEAIAEFGEGSTEATAALGRLATDMHIFVQNTGAAAKAAAVQHGVSDGLNEAYAAQVAVLKELEAAGGAQGAEAERQRKALEATTASAWLGNEGFAALKDSIIAVPDAKTVTISADAYQANKTVIDTNYNVKHMDDGTVQIYAKDNATATANSIVSGIGKMTATISVGASYIGGFAASVVGGGGVNWKWRDGGYIDQGSHPRVDDVPALLAKGEYVLHAGAVKALGVDFLNELNSIGKTSGARTASQIRGKFADGGSTDDWFERALRRVNSGGVQASMNTPVSARAQAAPVGGNTFILPPVDPYSMAREVNRLNGREVDLL